MVRDAGFEPVGQSLTISELQKRFAKDCDKSQAGAKIFREGFEICEVMAAWSELPYACRAGTLQFKERRQTVAALYRETF